MAPASDSGDPGGQADELAEGIANTVTGQIGDCGPEQSHSQEANENDQIPW